MALIGPNKHGYPTAYKARITQAARRHPSSVVGIHGSFSEIPSPLETSRRILPVSLTTPIDADPRKLHMLRSGLAFLSLTLSSAQAQTTDTGNDVLLDSGAARFAVDEPTERQSFDNDLGVAWFDPLLAVHAMVVAADDHARQVSMGAVEETEVWSLPEVYRLELAFSGGLGPEGPEDDEQVPTSLRIPIAPDVYLTEELVDYQVLDDGTRTWVGHAPGDGIPNAFLVTVGDTWVGEILGPDGWYWIRPAPNGGHVVTRASGGEPELVDESIAAGLEAGQGAAALNGLAGGDEESGECGAEPIIKDLEVPNINDFPYPPAAGQPAVIDLAVGYTPNAQTTIFSQWTGGGYTNHGLILGQPDDTPWGTTPTSAPAAVLGYVRAKVLQTNNILARSGISAGVAYIRLAGLVKVKEKGPDPWSLPPCPTSEVVFQNGCGKDIKFERCIRNPGVCSCCPDATTWSIEEDGVYEKGEQQWKSRIAAEPDPMFPQDYELFTPLCSEDFRPACVADLFTPSVGDHDTFPDQPEDPLSVARFHATGANPSIPLFTQVDGRHTLHQFRELVGADLVGVLQGSAQGQTVGNAVNWLGAGRKPLLERSGAGFAVSVLGGPTDRWTFSHELGHVLGIVHGTNPGDIWRANAGFRATGPGGRTTLMHSQDSQGTPRLPILSNHTLAWVPGVRTPANDSYRVDGSLIPMLPGPPPTPPAGSLALGDTLADEVGYLTSPWDFGFTPLQARAAHYPTVANSELRLVSPQDHATATPGGPMTFVWFGSSHAIANPGLADAYTIQLGTTFGASNLASVNIPGSTTNLVTWDVTWTWPGPVPSTPFFARIGWQLAGPAWVYRDYAFNVADQLISCASEDPAFASGKGSCAITPVGGGAPVAPCAKTVVDAGLPTERVQLVCDLGAGGVPAIPTSSGWAAAVGRLPAWQDYDYWLMGRTLDNQPWCCVYDAHEQRVSFIGLVGTSEPETFNFGGMTVPSPLPNDPLQPYPPYPSPRLASQVRALGGADTLYGSTWSATNYWEYLLGQRGPDTIYGFGGKDWVSGGQESDILDGGDQPDVLIDISGTDVMLGGPHSDLLCTGDGGDTLNAGTDAETVYASLGATASAVTTGAGSTCGWATAPPAPPAWGGGNCLTGINVVPADCNDPLACPGGPCVP